MVSSAGTCSGGSGEGGTEGVIDEKNFASPEDIGLAFKCGGESFADANSFVRSATAFLRGKLKRAFMSAKKKTTSWPSSRRTKIEMTGMGVAG